jgi:hypothetical protein
MGVSLAVSAAAIVIAAVWLWRSSKPTGDLSDEWRRNQRYSKDGW